MMNTKSLQCITPDQATSVSYGAPERVYEGDTDLFTVAVTESVQLRLESFGRGYQSPAAENRISQCSRLYAVPTMLYLYQYLAYSIQQLLTQHCRFTPE